SSSSRWVVSRRSLTQAGAKREAGAVGCRARAPIELQVRLVRRAIRRARGASIIRCVATRGWRTGQAVGRGHALQPGFYACPAATLVQALLPRARAPAVPPAMRPNTAPLVRPVPPG